MCLAEALRSWRVDRVAKELAWKASKVLKPRGFESHALRQKRNTTQCGGISLFCSKAWDENPKGQLA